MAKVARIFATLGTGLGVSAIVGWLFLRERRRNHETDSPTLIKSQLRSEAADMPNIILPLDALTDADLDTADMINESTTSDAEDDLTQINDIGSRFAEALHAVGITQYAQLAQQTPEILAAKLTPHVRVSAQRIQEKNWVGQAARLAKRQE